MAKSKIITVIPVFNGEKFILQTLESVAAQRLKPDRVIVIDNCSTDGTEKIVKEFTGIKCEWQRNATNLGLFGNCNRALEFCEETDYLHILHADDLIVPEYYEMMVRNLEDCDGFGMGYCLDERIDENNKHLSISGKADGTVTIQAVDDYLKQKAEIGNQAFSGTLLKSHYQKAPCQFRLDMPILADMVYWPDWGRHCKKIVKINLPLSKYRWHGDNTTTAYVPGLQTLVLDEWQVMQMVEGFRGQKAGSVRWFKLKGLFAVRSGIKAKRFKEQQKLDYSRQIVSAVKKITGPIAWLLGQVVVETRDLVVYRILGRPKHPKNVYS
ncbi:glycosyltransferase family 2 protein [Pedosphaera parvula]|uniref:Glycosyl transferase family 2 n=1 Tax=Pedosphaera parvula (strain Ellin514) TaxID=320771 RepID=B9XIQ1_PEDPL|nr:glycosyltransferase family A protein [Pedosphaera parvula]EEF60314.1 glycosyl transferase family 2 [Pedosphaera parvula Ellin514]